MFIKHILSVCLMQGRERMVKDPWEAGFSVNQGTGGITGHKGQKEMLFCWNRNEEERTNRDAERSVNVGSGNRVTI